PTLGDGVIIGSGAQVLGPINVGVGARIGANSVVHKDIPAGVTAVGIPARVVMPRDKAKAKEFVAYGEPVDGCPDPVLRTIEDLRHQVASLMTHVEELEGRLQGNETGGKREKNETVAISGGKK
ncbi:MAG: serine O-acetyltransferase, partial [Alphaproteobacteria bacterium]